MFGLDPKTAIRYASNARQLLTTAAEEHDPGNAASTKSRSWPPWRPGWAELPAELMQRRPLGARL